MQIIFQFLHHVKLKAKWSSLGFTSLRSFSPLWSFSSWTLFQCRTLLLTSQITRYVSWTVNQKAKMRFQIFSDPSWNYGDPWNTKSALLLQLFRRNRRKHHGHALSYYADDCHQIIHRLFSQHCNFIGCGDFRVENSWKSRTRIENCLIGSICLLWNYYK